LDLFRKEKISHYELSQMLGFDRFETDRFLIEHNEFAQSLTLEDLEKDFQTGMQILKEQNK
jgi:predicted HTH domain antitoxin